MLRDFALKDGRLLVKQTGAEIAINSEFFRELARGASFVGEVRAITAARAAKAQINPFLKRAEQAAPARSPKVRICFGPVSPLPWYAIWPVAHLAGFEITKSVPEADILFYFQDTEFTEAAPFTGHHAPVLNGRCLDIRKSRVAEIFLDVFGYSLAVDPMTHDGLALQKSERNGVHDGQILPCPYFTPREGYVYQRLIDNTQDGRTYTDIRTPIVGGTIPAVYLKHRTSSTRFSNDNVQVDLTTAEEQFSQEEQARIIEFARRMHLDFGGLDVLRDRKDGRIYIVDVNKTDMGPPTALPRHQKLVAMQKLADAFRHFVLAKLEDTAA